jgi:hypothetical protein
MKQWVATWRVEPPINTVVSVRFGSSVCFAAYSKILDQWHLIANGTEAEIAEPPMWFCEDQWAAEHQRKDFRARTEVRSCRKKKDAQLLLGI